MALVLMTALYVGSAAADLTLNFSSIEGASINFNGTSDTFSFPSTGTRDFQIDDSAPANSSAIGYLGTIEGTFTIGAITQSGLIEEAPVTGSGTFEIYDSDNKPLKGTITWASIFSYKKSGGIDPEYDIDGEAFANLTSVTYAGNDPDLKQFLAGGTVNATYQFSGSGFKSLSYLTTDGVEITTSYSGSLSAVPLPGALVLLGMAVVRLVAYNRRRRDLD